MIEQKNGEREFKYNKLFFLMQDLENPNNFGAS